MMLSKRNLGLPAAVALMFLAVLIPRTEGQSPAKASRVSWQYKSLVHSSRQVPDEALNRLGRDGWELVTVNQDPRGDSLQFILKRPRRDAEAE